jgi:3'-phosphoadenosine 5'-phosphosulfate sulfotransferase (PAPS reductase)/FAD synthetase
VDGVTAEDVKDKRMRFPEAATLTASRLSHLQRLEAESIHIMREVAAEFANPVMLYSIGKDSSVMLHLAMKAFYPSKPPFPLMHVDTTWKFREMISFRDETVKRLGVKLIVYINEDGVRRGINPIDSGSNLHTQVMKTDALKAALNKYGSTPRSAARAATKRRAARKSAFSRSAPRTMPGTRRTSGRSSGSSTTRASARVNRSACFRSRIGRSSMSGNTSWPRTSRSCRSILRRNVRS